MPFVLPGGSGRGFATAGGDRIVNAMTVDVEDYFQVSAFDRTVRREDWERLPSRVSANTGRVLDLLADAGVQATFFVLGWIAERYPGLVRAIASRGHEVASHGYAHALVYDMTPAAFRADVRRAKAALEDAGAGPIVGFRAPSYSITRASLWAIDVLIEEGFEYDASVYPIHHDRYGIPGAPRHPHRIDSTSGALWELPGATVRLGGQNLPIGGGGYFRLLPYAWTRRGIRSVNDRERQPVVFYIHPWELDPEQPRLPGTAMSRLRHYRNLDKTEGRLRRLLNEFCFAPAATVLADAPCRERMPVPWSQRGPAELPVH